MGVLLGVDMKNKGHKSSGDYCNWHKTRSFIEERLEFETNCGNVHRMETTDKRNRPRIDTCPWCNRGVKMVQQ